MKLNTSYKQIITLSVPIMLGSAAQNIIVLSDNIFLYHYNLLDFEASGLVGVFYLIIASIGYGFSRGGQIIIARRNGERNFEGSGAGFQALLLFEIALALLFFGILHWFSEDIFRLFIHSEDLISKCVEYIGPRSYGLFFSYTGIALISFYTGIARTKFIIYDTIVLIIFNLALNYILIFGKFGFKPMGIAGAAWASTIAELIAFVLFVLYMILDRDNVKYRLYRFSTLHMPLIKQMFNISLPIVIQSILGIGSWFLFFSFIENTGREELAISNLLRNVYLILSIPSWGFSAGINTMVSSFIGSQKRQAVVPLIIKTAKLNILFTTILSIPVVLFPKTILYPLFGGSHTDLIALSQPYFLTIFFILIVFSAGGIAINGLIGTGQTQRALWIQVLFTIFYLIYIYFMVKLYYINLHWAWGVEIFYWGGILTMSMHYLNSRKWFLFKL